MTGGVLPKMRAQIEGGRGVKEGPYSKWISNRKILFLVKIKELVLIADMEVMDRFVTLISKQNNRKIRQRRPHCAGRTTGEAAT